MTISKSPDKGSFNIGCHIKSHEEKGTDPNTEYLRLLQSDLERKAEKEADPEWQKENLEYDLRTTNWILTKVRNDDIYAQNLYCAMCNNEFMKADVWPILNQEKWSCSWRYAGGIIADMQQKGDYIDWYCSGIRNDGYQDDLDVTFPRGYVSEGQVTNEIREDLLELGWIVLDEDSSSLAI